ncbi:hypothetical protein CFC21_038684 [Triticum aestivum]|uniref:Late embryogenesis abundant protein LEA-2 subgroup domain-containing protein n=2 Tax=Triticum aestivum TaxID=4565 RepID=A0A3B6ETV5_WHEAT|nr:hypothetical protein CFC21_038684 [Triticum aestivum]
MGCLDRCCTLTVQNFLKRWFLYSIIILCVGITITGIILFVLRLAFKPHVEASIEDARLTSFGTTEATTSSSFLEYSISVAISIHNPTWGFVKHTKPLVASIAFDDNSLLNVSVAGEGHRYRPSKKEVHFLQKSGKVLWDVLGRAALEDFKQQSKMGVFSVEVRLSGEITIVGLDNVVTRNKRNLGFSCPLSLQLPPPGHGVVLFHEVNCKPEPENIYF